MRVEMQVCGARAGGRVYGGFLIVLAIERGTRNKEDKKRARGHECEKGDERLREGYKRAKYKRVPQ